MSEGSVSTQGGEPPAVAAPVFPAAAVNPPVVAPAKPALYTASGFPKKHSGAWFTLPLLCAGIGLISCALLIGQVENNRRLAWQRAKLQTDLESFQKQIDTNQDFLNRLSSDSNLAERLAQRQMKLVREGSAILELNGPGEDTSPFRLVTVAPPPAVKPYEPDHSLLTKLFSDTHLRLYAYGLGAFMIAVSLITGASDTLPGGRK
jgi:hypothetical protein